MQTYTSYKSSNIDWIGEIPSHWSIKKLKYVAKTVTTGGTPPTDNELYFENGNFDWFTPADFSDDLILNSSKRKITELAITESNIKVYPSNSILFVGIGATLGKIGINIKECSSNQQVNAIIVENEISCWFVAYFLKINIDSLKMLANSATLPILNQSQTKEISVPFPLFKEQKAIVNYLAPKTALIDELIKKKERKIELLKEQRSALINHVVTKGLNANVAFKDSDIEWIGEIPEHWEAKRLKYLIKDLESGISVNSIDMPVSSNNDIGVLKTSCVYEYFFNSAENKKVVSEDIERVKCFVKSDSLIISRMNTPDLVGACGYVKEDMRNLYLPDRLWQTVFFSMKNLKVRWLYYVLICSRFREVLSFLATGTSSSMKNITKDDFLNIVVPFPNLEEQEGILNYLDNQLNLIDKTISIENLKIEKLKEYRQTLISNVVTGKIKIASIF